MSKIDYQALREAAQNAKDLVGIKNYKRGEQAVAEFESLITPHIVLALMDELERNQQYIKRRDQENEDIALTVGKLRVELESAEAMNKHLELAIRKAEGCSEALRRKTEAAEKRISELEAREVVPDEMTPKQASRSYCVEVRGYRDGWNACRSKVIGNMLLVDMDRTATDNTNQQFESLAKSE